MERPITIEGPCLDCAHAIPEADLAREQLSPEERRAQAYVDGALAEDVEEPSVVTLNAVATSLAATDFLLTATGLMPATTALDASAYYPQERELRARIATKRPTCRFCSGDDRSVLGRGDLKRLSLKPGSRRPHESPPEPQSTRGLAGWVSHLFRRRH
jgi:hypothetical protein